MSRYIHNDVHFRYASKSSRFLDTLYDNSLSSYLLHKEGKKGWTLRDFGLIVSKRNIFYGTVIALPFLIPHIIINSIFIDSEEVFIKFDCVKGLIYAFLVYPFLSILWAEFHEEFRFRGYMQNLLSKEINELVGFVSVSIYFAYGHFASHPEYDVLALTYLLLLALVFGLEFYVYRNIVITMTTHFWLNVVGTWTFAVHYYTRFGHIFSLSMIFIIVLGILRYKWILVDFVSQSRKIFENGWNMWLYGIILGLGLLFYKYLLWWTWRSIISFI